MNRKLTGALAAAIIMLFCAPLQAQLSTAVFVVYGNAYDQNGVPVDDHYLITVTNLNNGMAVETEVESGSNSGRYSAVFVDLTGSAAATEGDLIRVEAMEYATGESFVCREHTITADEITSGEAFFEQVINTESASWGAVKQIYRN